MQFAICRSTTNTLDADANVLTQSGLHWMKFGQDYFCYSADPAKPVDWKKVETSGVRRDSSALRSSASGARSLHLVTQEGRSFQRAHPNVPVLLDKGRHLIVSLDKRKADKIVPHAARFSMRPATANEVIFETLPRPHVAPRIGDRAKSLVDAVSRTSFAAAMTELASFPTRHSLSTHFQEAARKMRDQLDLMGYEVSVQNVRIPGGTTMNIIANKRGIGGEGRSLTLVGAHLDSINLPANPSQPEDPRAPAPGADDNASGSAGVIEIARVLKDRPMQHDLRLVLFGGEEQGLLGSTHFVNGLPPAERARTKSVVNMDMIAVLNTRRPAVLLEGGDPVSKNMVASLAAAAHACTELTVNTSFEPHDSDHCPFIDAGVPAALTIEGNDEANENVHTANDTLAHVNHDLALEILRMNIAFIAGEVGV